MKLLPLEKLMNVTNDKSDSSWLAKDHKSCNLSVDWNYLTELTQCRYKMKPKVNCASSKLRIGLSLFSLSAMLKVFDKSSLQDILPHFLGRLIFGITKPCHFILYFGFSFTFFENFLSGKNRLIVNNNLIIIHLYELSGSSCECNYKRVSFSTLIFVLLSWLLTSKKMQECVIHHTDHHQFVVQLVLKQDPQKVSFY